MPDATNPKKISATGQEKRKAREGGGAGQVAAVARVRRLLAYRGWAADGGGSHAASPKMSGRNSAREMPVRFSMRFASSTDGLRSPFNIRVTVDGSTPSRRASVEGRSPDLSMYFMRAFMADKLPNRQSKVKRRFAYLALFDCNRK